MVDVGGWWRGGRVEDAQRGRMEVRGGDNLGGGGLGG